MAKRDSSLKFVDFNANYFGAKTKDCVIRALAVACDVGYAWLCGAFGRKFGPTLDRGVTVDELDAFALKYRQAFMDGKGEFARFQRVKNRK